MLKEKDWRAMSQMLPGKELEILTLFGKGRRPREEAGSGRPEPLPMAMASPDGGGQQASPSLSGRLQLPAWGSLCRARPRCRPRVPSRAVVPNPSAWKLFS